MNMIWIKYLLLFILVIFSLIGVALKWRHSADVEAFYAGVQKGRDVAMKESGRVGIEVSADGWIVYLDTAAPSWQRDAQDKIVDQGTWNTDTQFGSTIPNKRFFFTRGGRCYVNQSKICKDDIESETVPKESHTFTFTSLNANRIYTMFFDKDGKPNLVYDNF
jgi:hypothetical protein